MANASLFLDNRRPLADGTLRVRIRVTDQRKSAYFFLPFSYDEATFKKVIDGKYLNKTHLKESAKISKELKRAQAIIDDLNPFSFSSFKLRFTARGDRSDIINLLREQSDLFKENDKFSSSNLYRQASNLFAAYAKAVKKEDHLKVDSLTPKELTTFEAWAVGKGYSLTTIGMYMVRTKAIINTLIRSGEFNKANYPFGRKEHGLYPLPKATNAKRPLGIDEIMKMYNYKTKTELQAFAKDMFLFSYLASGMNFYDIFKLKRSDFDKDRFTFIRKKTEHKKSDKITVLLNDDLRSIIEHHSVLSIGNEYLFKIITPKMTPEEENKAVRRAVSSINTALKTIAKKIDIPTTISSYYARHSFANNLMESEAPLAFISKKLGHSDLATTQNYLDQFTKEKDEMYTTRLLKKA